MKRPSEKKICSTCAECFYRKAVSALLDAALEKAIKQGEAEEAVEIAMFARTLEEERKASLEDYEKKAKDDLIEENYNSKKYRYWISQIETDK